MTIDEYWARIQRVPLRRERESTDSQSVLFRAQDGAPVLVTKPDSLSEDERESVVQFYESQYAPRLN